MPSAGVQAVSASHLRKSSTPSIYHKTTKRQDGHEAEITLKEQSTWYLRPVDVGLTDLQDRLLSSAG